MSKKWLDLIVEAKRMETPTLTIPADSIDMQKFKEGGIIEFKGEIPDFVPLNPRLSDDYLDVLKYQMEQLFETAMTNQNAFGVQPILAPRGSIDISNDYDELLAEFEKMLNGEDFGKFDPKAKPLSKESQEAYAKFCKHEFISKGVSIFNGQHYIKCKFCNLSESDYKHEQKYGK